MNQLRKIVEAFDLPDALVLSGLVLVSIGAAQVYAPLGWIVPGAASIGLGVLMGRAD